MSPTTYIREGMQGRHEPRDIVSTQQTDVDDTSSC